MSGSERERNSVFLSFLVQQNTGGGRRFKSTEHSSTENSVRGISLSLSLSLSVFVVAFHQTHLIPVKDRQTDRQKNRETERQTDRRMSLSLSLSRSFGISRREFDVSFFQERIETPPQLLSNNYWRRRRPGNLITR